MSEIAATTVHEAYAFACMRCGYGWEQAYEIEHHVDASNHAFVVYKADGERVPSPLSTPTCTNCGGHVVRIMRAGRVSTVQQLLQNRRPAADADAGAEPREAVAATAAPAGDHHWHLSDLLHPFHRR
ncbi:hypothetical protein P8A21_15650 [Streptomyces poriferorum]|uniref:C2H2-type domain-containing protein n=1 Tax=Streptomyces poriferorum TaxID=2798799 RepID=A0ABY9IWS8_9ACTN|nr:MULTISPECIES: hypothetical protein [Streptomyces]WSQ45935.1 hypothetical protein OG345_24580 [Streptomyces sp. NBC_01220]MBW5252883.1 hypothetical protein [Streptomyces poriferorum]MBW5258837.1 hypothetical protein [Streptomyces poriferorum]MDP5312483.1 hypothetical protein [Streptomyces sp. Alt4]WLQ48841.1 hypothetical protein P8A21_15650 [Streptomyces sp. Alt1]